MTVAVRLPEELEHELRQLAARTGHTLSDCVREACVAYIAQQPEDPDGHESAAYRSGKHLFGSAESGDATRWSQRRQIIHDAMNAKHRARRPRAH
jgi:plasmid stability protein